MKTKELPPVELLDILFEYREGYLVRRLATSSNEAGTIVEGILRSGYLTTQVLGITYSIHRVIWKMIHREEPPEIIDHKNRIKTDNRIENLRASDNSLNYMNSDRYDQVLAAKAKRLEPEEGRRRARRMRPTHLKRLREQLGLASLE